MSTRRTFLKLLALLPWANWARAALVVEAQEETSAVETQEEAQEWGFSLAFPAYFPESPSDPHSERGGNRVYLPHVGQG